MRRASVIGVSALDIKETEDFTQALDQDERV